MGPMDVCSLGYLRITAEDPHNWVGFATHVLGMQAVPGDGDAVHLRMDERHHRIAIEEGSPAGGTAYGWEVADAAALDDAAAALEAAGVAVMAATKAELGGRRGAGVIHRLGPPGARGEAFFGPHRENRRAHGRNPVPL